MKSAVLELLTAKPSLDPTPLNSNVIHQVCDEAELPVAQRNTEEIRSRGPQNLNVTVPAFQGSPTEIRQAREAHIRQASIVLVLDTNGPERLDAKLRDLSKATALSRTMPIGVTAIFSPDARDPLIQGIQAVRSIDEFLSILGRALGAFR